MEIFSVTGIDVNAIISGDIVAVVGWFGSLGIELWIASVSGLRCSDANPDSKRRLVTTARVKRTLKTISNDRGSSLNNSNNLFSVCNFSGVFYPYLY